MIENRSSKPEHQLFMDYMRAIACMIVLSYHMGLQMTANGILSLDAGNSFHDRNALEPQQMGS